MSKSARSPDMPLSRRRPAPRYRRHDAALIQALVIATLLIGSANVLAGLGRW